MKVRIIVNEEMSGWILGKIARKLKDELLKLNVEADIHEDHDSSADINHYMLYLNYEPAKKTDFDTLMITHVDNQNKLQQIGRQMQSARLGICMSRETMMMLQNYGIEPTKLCYVNPAHDGVIRQKKIVIGLAFKVYIDGRKREQLLVKLADKISAFTMTLAIISTL